MQISSNDTFINLGVSSCGSTTTAMLTTKSFHTDPNISLAWSRTKHGTGNEMAWSDGMVLEGYFLPEFWDVLGGQAPGRKLWDMQDAGALKRHWPELLGLCYRQTGVRKESSVGRSRLNAIYDRPRYHQLMTRLPGFGLEWTSQGVHIDICCKETWLVGSIGSISSIQVTNQVSTKIQKLSDDLRRTHHLILEENKWEEKERKSKKRSMQSESPVRLVPFSMLGSKKTPVNQSTVLSKLLPHAFPYFDGKKPRFV